MTLYATATDRFSDAGTLARASLALSSRWALGCISLWRKWRSIHAAGLLLDCMNDGALEELGMKRVGRGTRWLDGREAFPRGDFGYHVLRDDAGRRGAD